MICHNLTSNKVQCELFIVKNYNNEVLLLCIVMLESSGYAVFSFHPTDVVVGIKLVFYRDLVDA